VNTCCLKNVWGGWMNHNISGWKCFFHYNSVSQLFNLFSYKITVTKTLNTLWQRQANCCPHFQYFRTAVLSKRVRNSLIKDTQQRNNLQKSNTNIFTLWNKWQKGQIWLQKQLFKVSSMSNHRLFAYSGAVQLPNASLSSFSLNLSNIGHIKNYACDILQGHSR